MQCLLNVESRPLLHMQGLLARGVRNVHSARVFHIARSSIWTMSSTMNIKSSRVIQSRPLSNEDAKWVGLRAIEWTDASGKARVWESADRRTRSGDVDGRSLYIDKQPWLFWPS